MKISRRDFLLLTAGFAAGCKTGNAGPPAAGQQTVNAGPAGDFISEGVYGRFRDRGFFVVRAGEKLFALSSFCTHRRCQLTAQPNRSFLCPCHGSTFDSTGHVMAGPARRDLPILPARVNAEGNLIIEMTGM